MPGQPVVDRRTFEIYGLGVEIGFARKEDAMEVSRLLKLFIRERTDKIDLHVNYLKKERGQEIAVFLIPALSRIGIWAIHAGGVHSWGGGILLVGPSGSGKSTFTYRALKSRVPIVSDDITLLKENEKGITLLPFFSTIYFGDDEIIPNSEKFRPVSLKYLLFPRKSEGVTIVREINKKSKVAKRLVTSLLWAYEAEMQEKQRRFIEKLCKYPAFEVYWNNKLFDDPFYFRGILDEII